jgi:hypothetical protein
MTRLFLGAADYGTLRWKLGDGESLDARRKPLAALARLVDADEVTNTLDNATGGAVCDAKPGTDDAALHWVGTHGMTKWKHLRNCSAM